MGEDTRIRFWHDRWIGDNTLKDLYPKLYVCSAAKDACMSEVLWIPERGTVSVWVLRFYRAFEDWELAASYSLLQLIQTCIPRVDRRDTLCWGSKVMVSLTSGLTTKRFGVLRILCFLGRMFGNQRFLSEWLSFCGQLLMIEFSLWIISCIGVALWQIGVVCVVVMRNRWTTFFFIVLLHIPYGLLCFRLLVFIGLCQDRWRDCYLVGISGLGSIIQTFGI